MNGSPRERIANARQGVEAPNAAVASARNRQSGSAGAVLGSGRAFVMIVQELRELFAQAFVALSLMAEHDRPLEQIMLHLLGQVAPTGNHRITQNAREPVDLRVDLRHRLLPFAVHERACLIWSRAYQKNATLVTVPPRRAGAAVSKAAAITSARKAACIKERLLVRARHAREHSVAMRKAAEPPDDVGMDFGMQHALGIGSRAAERDAALLIRDVLRMHVGKLVF